MEIHHGEITVANNVTSLFTNVPLEESIQILANKAFTDDWFNKTYKLKLHQGGLGWPPQSSHQKPTEHTDGVSMGLPLGPLLANVIMCSIETTLYQDGKQPPFYWRYVDDTLTIMPDRKSADCFLCTLNDCHHSLKSKWTFRLTPRSLLPVYI